MKFSLVLSVCCCLCFCSYSQSRSENNDTLLNSQPFISWAKQHAMPLQHSDSATGNADLQPLKKMIGNARVIALGEPAHGFHEPLAFRNRLFRFLVENCGFTTIVLEAGLAQSRAAIDFVAGRPGSAKDAASKLSIASASAENIELLEWMRKYNVDPTHTTELKFYGMDIQLMGFPRDTTPSYAAITETLAYLKQVDPEEAGKMNASLAPYLNRLSVAGYPLLLPDEQSRLSSLLDDIIALYARERINYIAGSSEEQYEWGYRNALVAQQTDRLVKITPLDKSGEIPAAAWKAVNARDGAMADNVIWILQHEANGGKVLVFAHNAHVKNTPTMGGVWSAFAKPPNGMGQYLRSILKNDLFIIGSSVEPQQSVNLPGSFDKALMQVDKPRFLLDLKPALSDPSVASWLRTKRPMEANKVSHFILPVSEAFDAILYMNKAR